MALKVNCPGCGAVLSLPDAVAGKTIRCTRCKATFVAPAPADDLPAARPVRRGAGAGAAAGSARSRRRDDDDVDVPESGGGNNTALIVGGVVAGVLVLGVITFLLLRPKSDKDKPSDEKTVAAAGTNTPANAGRPENTTPRAPDFN